jgi:hypothetical protein
VLSPKRLGIWSARSSVLLIVLNARTRVWGGTTLVPSTPAVQAENAAAATDRLYR